MKLSTTLLRWYRENGRDLPWRKTRNPYLIWVSEIILQQTRVEQGLAYYLRFTERFPDIRTLAKASVDEVLLYWKGLGYYSRALNMHQAAKQIMQNHKGKFPDNYQDILSLKGVGKYTAAAIAGICFDVREPSIDGNYFRVLSRLFADDFDISASSAFKHFRELGLKIMPEKDPGDFNQAMMDLGSQVCTPRNPDCEHCPIRDFCVAYKLGKVSEFPVKRSKVAVKSVELKYYFIRYRDEILIQRRDRSSIWKNLYEFPTEIPEEWTSLISAEKQVKHKLTHRDLFLTFYRLELSDEQSFIAFAKQQNLKPISLTDYMDYSFPRPLEQLLENWGEDS